MSLIPQSTFEQYIDYLTKGKGEIPTPISDSDKFLHYLCVGHGELPIPNSRMEQYLDYLCKNGGVGGSGGNDILLSGLEKVVTIIPESAKINDIYYVITK